MKSVMSQQQRWSSNNNNNAWRRLRRPQEMRKVVATKTLTRQKTRVILSMKWRNNTAKITNMCISLIVQEKVADKLMIHYKVSFVCFYQQGCSIIYICSFVYKNGSSVDSFRWLICYAFSQNAYSFQFFHECFSTFSSHICRISETKVKTVRGVTILRS